MSDDSVEALGEFGLIERIRTLVGPTRAVVGIGDDAAVLDVGSADYLLATVDMLVQGVHFSDDADPEILGRHALAVNLSDIAAMGGTPTFALSSLALPSDTTQRFVEGLYRGLAAEANRFDVALVGGNISSTDGPVVLDVTLLGVVPKDELLLREGAQPGDVLVVSGVLGGRTAQRLLQNRQGGKWRFDPPEPRLALARALASRHLVHAAIDLSDGLGSDVHHLAERSTVGAVLYEDSIPAAVVTRKVAEDLELDPCELALYGGEDYELLLAIPEDCLDRAIEAAGSLSLYSVGTVLEPEHGIVLQRGAERYPLRPQGWRHF